MFNSAVKVNPQQKTILFDTMSQNRHLLEQQSADTSVRRSKNALWEKLTAELNKHGPGKDIAQWKKCWRDLRLATRKKYLKVQRSRKSRYHLDDYEKYIIRACGMECIEDENGELQTAVDEKELEKELEPDDDVEHVENKEIKQEQIDEKVPSGFEILNVAPEETTNEQELLSGTIKIEEPQITPGGVLPIAESVLLSRESPSNESNSSHATPSNKLNASGASNSQDETIVEIRKMHRNLLRESRKQTALLKKLLNRLT